MNASLTIGGIEVGIVTPAGPLERLVASRYAPFLGAVRSPVCSLRLEPPAEPVDAYDAPFCAVERTGAAKWNLAQPGFGGVFDADGASVLRSAVSPLPVDDCLRLVFSLLAPLHRGVLLRASGLIASGGAAHVFAGDSGAGRAAVVELAKSRPLLSDGWVMLRRPASKEWSASATPFRRDYGLPGPPRESRLGRLWLVQHPTDAAFVAGGGPASPADAQRMLLAGAVFPGADARTMGDVAALVGELVTAVPAEDLRVALTAASWRQIEARAG